MPNEPSQCGGKATPPLSEGSTPYGYWHCDGGEWVWVPSYGKVQPPKKKKPKK